MPSTITQSLAIAAAAGLFGCVAPLAPPPAVPPSPLEMAQFWVEPADLPERDLFVGPWGLEHAPDPTATYVFKEKKKQGIFGGFSPGYTVRGPGGIEWSAKQGPEAQAEVTASRLVWALGFHQPAAYFVEKWTLSGGANPGEQTRARFRPEIGETGKFRADRNDIVEFETEAFTKGVSSDKVKFNWSGFHKELVSDLTPADVHWTCERLARLSDRQWQDAFRAGGYDSVLAERYIRRFKQKIAEGLALR